MDKMDKCIQLATIFFFLSGGLSMLGIAAMTVKLVLS